MDNLRNVSVLLLYKQDKVLLQLRDEKAPIKPNMWAFFGGGIEEDETPEEAVRREIEEELEYKVKEPKYLFSLDMSKTKGQYSGIKYVFIEEYDESQNLMQHEGADMGWFTLEEARTLSNMKKYDLEVIEKVFDELNHLRN